MLLHRLNRVACESPLASILGDEDRECDEEERDSFLHGSVQVRHDMQVNEQDRARLEVASTTEHDEGRNDETFDFLQEVVL